MSRFSTGIRILELTALLGAAGCTTTLGPVQSREYTSYWNNVEVHSNNVKTLVDKAIGYYQNISWEQGVGEEETQTIRGNKMAIEDYMFETIRPYVSELLTNGSSEQLSTVHTVGLMQDDTLHALDFMFTEIGNHITQYNNSTDNAQGGFMTGLDMSGYLSHVANEVRRELLTRNTVAQR